MCHAVNCIKNCQKLSLQQIILCDNVEQAAANCHENSATYSSNSSRHKVSISYTTQTVRTVRSVTFSQTVTNALSSVTQWNLIVLWAVSSGASAQTVQRPTAALPSGVWHHWIHSLPKLYTETGTGIAVGLVVESYFETGNGARIGLWNMCALESIEDAFVWDYSIIIYVVWTQRG